MTRPGHRLHNSDLTVIAGLAGGEEHHEGTVSGSVFVSGNPPCPQSDAVQLYPHPLSLLGYKLFGMGVQGTFLTQRGY